ncbi:MAG: pyridoxamine 5'-phosphate oxidase family protein [Brachybacterium sp.]|nr:pyridoxamine 5'-phosphate oxidase family protein [Brachybacterium sp.]
MTNDLDLTQDNVVEKLRGASWVMLTTANAGGKLVSHPMVIQEVTDDADLYFFVGLQGDQADALQAGSQLNVAAAESGSWLSVSGRGEFVDNRAKLEELWNDEASAYFPGGLKDPNLGLMRVTTDSAQFWGLPGGKVAGIAQIVKARVSGERTSGGSDTVEL